MVPVISARPATRNLQRGIALLYEDRDILVVNKPAGLLTMASGCAVVATRVGAAHHIIVNEHTGYLVSPEDLDGLVSRLEILMRDPQLTLEMGQAGRAHVVNHFSIEREAAELERVYESVWHRIGTSGDG